MNDSLDFQFSEWTGVIYYDMFARLKALVEYQVAQIDYDDAFSRNGTFQQVRMGFEGDVLPNLLVKLRVGPQFRDYEEDDQPNFNSWVADFSAEYSLRDNIKMEFGFSREAVEATFATVNFYKEHALRAGIEYGFRPKWTLSSEFLYFRHDYEERATVAGRTGFRRDHHAQVNVGLRYLFRDWLEFETFYKYLRRNSNFSSFDYTNHQVSMTTSLAY